MFSASEAVKLKKVGQRWEFQSEAHLEDFFWLFLNELFGASPLRRQFPVSGQFCDILAVDCEGRLIVIELKNGEDRYVVSQISRYYDALLEKKPLGEIINYSEPIQLLVIAPNFHRDNLTDKKYSQLPIEFLQFEISEQAGELFFALRDLDGQEIKTLNLTYEEKNHERRIPEPPRRLLNLLTDVQEDARKYVLNAREQILGFHEKIKEISVSSGILYGTSKTRTCAELRYDDTRKTVALFLWLPHVTSRSTQAKEIVARMRIWTDWTSVSAVGHVPKGGGRMISFEEWHSASVRPLKKILPRKSWQGSPEKYFTDSSYREQFVNRNKFLATNPHYRSGLALPLEKYFDLTHNAQKSSLLTDFIDLALETWLQGL